MPASAPPARILNDFLDIYRVAEVELIRELAASVKRGTATADQMAAAIEGTRLRSRIDGIVRKLILAVLTGGASMLLDAAIHGGRTAIQDLSTLLGGKGSDYASPINQGALDNLGRSLSDTLTPAHLSITRVVNDAYKQVIGRASVSTLTGTTTRRESSQRALDEFAAQGITGFTDRRGRRWELSSYAEMAARAATARASVDAHTDRLAAQDIELVYVSDSPQECPLCRPYEGKVLTLGPSEPGVVETKNLLTGATDRVRVFGSLEAARAAGFMHPNCFPGEVLVSAPTGIRASDARWYEGELVVIHTAGGDELPVTPNHPVLTPEGWIAAGSVEVGQHVLRYVEQIDPVGVVAPGDVQVEAPIGDVHDSLRKASPVPPMRVPATAEQFHGDGGGQADVEVVLADGLLRDGLLAPLQEEVREGQLLGGSAELPILAGSSSAHEGRLCVAHSAARDVRGRGVLAPLLLGASSLTTPGGIAGVGPHAAAQEHRAHGGLSLPDPTGDLVLRDALLAEGDGLDHPGLIDDRPSVSSLSGRSHDAGLAEALVDGGGADADGGRDLAGRLAGQVAPDEVVHVERRQFAGHVYNLQTGDGWYVAGGIVVHNCTHSVSAYLHGATKLPQATENPEGYKARQQLRALERGIRKARRVEAAAMTPEAQRAAAAKVRAWQGRIRDHVKATGAKRQPQRERLMTGDAAKAGPITPGTPSTGAMAERLDLPATPAALPGPRTTLSLPAAPEPEPAPDPVDAVRKLTDAELDTAMAGALEAEDFDQFDILGAEADRRDTERQAREARTAAARERRQERAVAKEQRQAEHLESLLQQGYDEEAAVEEAYGVTVEKQRRDRAIASLRDQGYRGRSFAELARASYRDHVYQLYLTAEDATNGHMLNRRAEGAGVDPHTLFVGSEARARKHASDELKAWWDEHNRPTFDQWQAELLGDSASAARSRAAGEDFLQ